MVHENRSSARLSNTDGVRPRTPMKGAAQYDTQDTSGDRFASGHAATSDGYESTVKTKQLIALFHERVTNTPSRVKVSPMHTESTAPSSITPTRSGVDSTTHRASLPLLPERSDAPIEAFSAIADDDIISTTSSVSTISADEETNELQSGSTAATSESKKISEGKASSNEIREPALARNASSPKDELTRIRENHTKHVDMVEVSSSDQATSTPTQEPIPNTKSTSQCEPTNVDVLSLKTTLATTRKLISTIEDELKRRKTECKIPRSTRRVSLRKRKGFKFEQKNECVVLSPEDDTSLSTVQSHEDVDTTKVSTHMARVVEQLPHCEQAAILLLLQRDENDGTWNVASTRVKTRNRANVGS